MSAFLTDNPDTIIWGNWLTQRQKKNYLDISKGLASFAMLKPLSLFISQHCQILS